MEDKLPFYLLILPSIISGIFALFGAYIGSKSNKKAIQLQIRTPIITEFLSTMDICENERAAQIDLPSSFICLPLRTKISSAKILLKKEDQPRFELLVNKYINHLQSDIEYNYKQQGKVAGFEKSAEYAKKAKDEITKILTPYL